MNINLPIQVQEILDKLSSCGYEGYAVGGCVRDVLLRRKPKDWDICTNAIPEQIVDCFKGYRVIETGLKHGTVTIIIEGSQYEITTYRIDGKYSDNRHPDSVSFTPNLTEDLARRDFTINAMAYSPIQGLIDPYGGKLDLEDKVVKCVGVATERFNEDALRILRALRFSSNLCFEIDNCTADAIHECKGLLNNISMERIQSEFCKILKGDNWYEILAKYRDIIAQIIPEVESMFGFDQHNPYHTWDLWNHTLFAMFSTSKDLTVTIALFFHDIGKPQCYVEDDKGIWHYYGHSKVSADITKEIMTRMRFDNQTLYNVKELVLFHDSDIHPKPRSIKKWLNKLGEKQLRRLLEVKRGDIRAHSPEHMLGRLTIVEKVEKILDEVISSAECFKMKDLAINGRDLINMGIPEGKEIGEVLKYIFELVLEDNSLNNRVCLVQKVKEYERERLI